MEAKRETTTIIMAKRLAVFVVVGGVAVAIAWVFKIEPIKSVLPTWVTMKFPTAIGFILSGFIIYAISNYLQAPGGVEEIILPVCALVILMIMGTLLASSVIGINTGVEAVLVKEGPNAIQTVLPGKPAIATMMAFILIAFAGLSVLYTGKKSLKIVGILGWFVVLSGTSAICGYFINEPRLYFSITGVSTAMAFHTGVLFILCGAAMILLGQSKQARAKG